MRSWSESKSALRGRRSLRDAYRASRGARFAREESLVAVGVAVVMMGVAAYDFQLRRGGAAVGGLAALGLELDRCVVDVKAVAEGAVDAFEDEAAVRHGHLGDGDVAGERVAA